MFFLSPFINNEYTLASNFFSFIERRAACSGCIHTNDLVFCKSVISGNIISLVALLESNNAVITLF
jgi:hypothetical protein